MVLRVASASKIVLNQVLLFFLTQRLNDLDDVLILHELNHLNSSEMILVFQGREKRCFENREE